MGDFIVPLQAQQISRHYCATTASDLNNDYECPSQRVCQPPPHLEFSSNHDMFYRYSKQTSHNMSRAPHLTPSPKTRMNGDSRHIASRASESGKFFLFFGFILAPWKVSSLQWFPSPFTIFVYFYFTLFKFPSLDCKKPTYKVTLRDITFTSFYIVGHSTVPLSLRPDSEQLRRLYHGAIQIWDYTYKPRAWTIVSTSPYQWYIWARKFTLTVPAALPSILTTM